MVHHVVFALLTGLCLLEGAGTLRSTSKRELQTSNVEERLVVVSDAIPTTRSNAGQRRKMIIDADPGLDDAVAIFTAFGDPNVQVIAITCVNGNTLTENAAQNTLQTLTAAGKKDIPIFRGSPLPTMATYSYTGPATHFGIDGFGDSTPFKSNDSINRCLIKDEPAAVALTRLVRTYPGEITIVTLGPLTNIGMAIQLDPTFTRNVKEVHIMGGSATALGNLGPVAEFNFAWDPEAAMLVLHEMQCPMFVITWDLCLEYSLTWDQRVDLFEGPSQIAAFLRHIYANMKNETELLRGKVLSICDSLCVANALDPSVATSSFATHATMELCGTNTRGQMIVEKGRTKKKLNVNIVESIDLAKTISLIKKGVATH